MTGPTLELKRADLSRMAEDVVRDFVAHPPANAMEYGIRVTSGTTDAPIVVVTKYGPQPLKKYAGNCRILVCLGSRSVRLSNALHLRNQIDRTGPQRIMFMDMKEVASDITPLLEDYAPDCLSGFPSFAGICARHLGGSGPGVSLLQLAGERVMPSLKLVFDEHVPNAMIHMAYMATEVGVISTQGCAFLPVNQYHPKAGVHVDVLDPDESGTGDLVVSKQDEQNTLERYHIGDLGRMVPGTCPCGARITFEHLGRKDYDYIKIVGALVRREEFDRVVGRFGQLISDYRVEVSEVTEEQAIKGHIVLSIYRPGGAVTPALAEEIVRDFSRELFLTPTQTLAQLVQQGTFLPLTVEFQSVPFRKKHKDIKISMVT